jgi:hypothetical protein
MKYSNSLWILWLPEAETNNKIYDNQGIGDVEKVKNLLSLRNI